MHTFPRAFFLPRDRRLPLTFALIALALVLMATPSHCTDAKEQPSSGKDLILLAESNSLLGSYLAGRVARTDQDIETAAQYYRKALDRDPTNEAILSDAFQLELSAGHVDEAARLARRLIQTGNGEFALAYLLLSAEATRAGDAKRVEIYLNAVVQQSPIIELTVNVSKAWLAFERKRPKTALKVLGDVGSADRQKYFSYLHSALLADLAGNKALADKQFARALKAHPRNRRISEAYARHAAHWGDPRLAQKILKPLLEDKQPHAIMRALSQHIAAGEKPALMVGNAKQGMAEIYFGIGGVLASNRVYDVARIFLQIALLLDPTHQDTRYLLGEVEMAAKRYQPALVIYEQIPESYPLWRDAQIRRALILSELKRDADAKAVLSPLIARWPDERRLPFTMGNILRDEKNYAEAARYYSRAIALISKPEPDDWTYYYARGISYERLKQWPKAEPDFKEALRLAPKEAAVLNYLGYSWVDQNIHLDKAMDLIRRAVDLKPDSGYFVDSLGWAYYRLGQYQKAVVELERAAELMSSDPVINDHLGDAYWRVGRRLEARYQWAQALGLKPEPEEVEKIQDKLKYGLDHQPGTRAAAKEQSAKPRTDEPVER